MNAPDPKELTDKANAAVRVLRMINGQDPLDTSAVEHYDVDVISQSGSPKAVYIRKDDKIEINAEFTVQGDKVLGVTFDFGGLGIQTEGETEKITVDHVPIGSAIPSATKLEPAQVPETGTDESPDPNVRTPIVINPI